MSEPLSGGRHLLDSLNPQQRRAVTYQGGPLLVLAGAGTGKTRVIVYRLAHLVASRVSPSNLVAVTFTNKAAREMSERAVELLGEEVARDLRVGTFHWLAHRILRRYGSALEIGSGFRLLTPRQSVAALRSTLQDLGYDPKVVSLPAVREAVAARRNEASRLPVTEVDAGLVTQRYSADLRRNRQVDLDGLILECIRLLQTHEHILRKIQGSVGHMLVDEYQDINRPQERLVSLLSGGTGQLTAVGDDDQAIYGWRFADASALRRFSERYRGAEIIRLEKNYRSTRRILRPANALLSHNRMRLGKELFGSGSGGVLPVIHAAGDEGEEARFVVERIRALLREGVPAEEIAVLFRINAESRVLEEALVHAGIGYQIRAGRRFYQRPEVARIIDLLRLA
ncbi:MAG TPA: UvrD-helicase domain-containing protein, partial [Chloroflexota bacterium]|nr:UvrD-helicase domain-containing protein [Chloroflexota bacterium]